MVVNNVYDVGYENGSNRVLLLSESGCPAFEVCPGHAFESGSPGFGPYFESGSPAFGASLNQVLLLLGPV